MKRILLFCFVVAYSVAGFTSDDSVRLYDLSFLEDTSGEMTIQDATRSPDFSKGR